LPNATLFIRSGTPAGFVAAVQVTPLAEVTTTSEHGHVGQFHPTATNRPFPNVMLLRLPGVPDVRVVQVIASGDVTMVPPEPTAANKPFPYAMLFRPPIPGFRDSQ
jgi:hypothetical protein